MTTQVEIVTELHDAFVSIISGHQDFAVDFDEAWQWIGYNQKSDALIMLQKNFVEGEEFSAIGLKTSGEKGGRPATHIMLTIDCFKAFCMLAQTDKGKEVRRYYIQLEKEVRLMGSTALRQLDPAHERRQLLAQIKLDKQQVQQLELSLLNNETYQLYREAQNRLLLNQKRLKSINSEIVSQLNLLADSQSETPVLQLSEETA